MKTTKDLEQEHTLQKLLDRLPRKMTICVDSEEGYPEYFLLDIATGGTLHCGNNYKEIAVFIYGMLTYDKLLPKEN